MKKYLKIIIITVMLTGLMFSTACKEKTVPEPDNAETLRIEYEISEIDTMETGTNIVLIDLEEKVVSNEKYSYENGLLIIKRGGCYQLTGSATGCNIIVDAYNDEVVQLLLDNVNIVSTDGPVLYATGASKLVLTLLDGTENVFSDSSEWREFDEDAPACVYAKMDLTINGTGKLDVFGYFSDGVRTTDQLKIINGVLSVKAKEEGLQGKDGVLITDGNISIQSEGTGIRSQRTGDLSKGYVSIIGGEVAIIAGKNGIEAVSLVEIKNSEVSIQSVQPQISCDRQQVDEDCIK